MIQAMYERIGTVFVGFMDTVSSVLLAFRNINVQYNPLINLTAEPTIDFREVRCEPSLSKEIFMVSGIVIITAVVIKYIWSSFRENDMIPQDYQIEKERKYKKENICGLKERYRNILGMKNYLTDPPEIEMSYPGNRIMLNERRKGGISRRPYSEVYKQQSSPVKQYKENEEKYSKLKENLLTALLLLEEEMKSKEMNDGDASRRNLGYWSNKEEIIQRLYDLEAQESMTGNKSAEVSTKRDRPWSKYTNWEKDINFERRTGGTADQFRQAANREEIMETLHSLGILESHQPTSRGDEVNGKSWSEYKNSYPSKRIFDSDVNVNPRMPNSVDQCTQVDRRSEVAETELKQAMVPFQDVEKIGKFGACKVLEEYGGLNAGKNNSKENEVQNSLKVRMMDIQSASPEQKVNSDCSSLELSSKRDKKHTSMLNLTASNNTINIELLLNRNTYTN